MNKFINTYHLSKGSATMRFEIHKFFDLNDFKIELKPIMVFCGDNGTGKTHLIKLLSTVSSFILNGELFRDIDNILKNEDYLYIKNNIFENGMVKNVKIDKEFSDPEEIIDRLEKLANLQLKKLNRELLKQSFGEINSDILSGMKIKFSKKQYINIKLSEEDNENSDSKILLEKVNEIVKKYREDLNEEISSRTLNILKTMIKETDNSINYSLSINMNKYVSNVGMSYQAENIEEKLLETSIMETILQQMLSMLFISELDIKIDLKDFYYLPASREAYHRDLEIFHKKTKKDKDQAIITRYAIDSKGKKTTNLSSKDPYIEKYIDKILELLATPVNDKIYNKSKDEIKFLETEFLRAVVNTNRDTKGMTFQLPNNKVISSNLASSLQNEYAFLSVLMSKETKPNLIIEEPESHLSISSSTKLTHLLLTHQIKHANMLWISTHNSFIGDSINNIIMISKLDKDKQKKYLNKLKLDKIVQEIPKDFINNIDAVLLANSTVEVLEKNDFGIDFTNFRKQIEDFSDIIIDLQLEIENNSHG